MIKRELALPDLVKDADFIEDKYQIARKIGIRQNPDLLLVQSYLQQRLTRGSIYNASSVLSNPGVFALIRLPLIGRMIKAYDSHDRQERGDLSFLNTQINTFLESTYPAQSQRRYARFIELAVNDLVAKATQAPAGSVIRFDPTEELLADWGCNWSKQIALNCPDHNL